MANEQVTRLRAGVDLGAYQLVRRVRADEDQALWEAREAESKAMVVLKLVHGPLNEEHAKLALAKLAEQLSSVQSPHVLSVQHHDWHGSWGFQVLGPLAGELLIEAREAGEQYPPATALRIAIDIASGLEALHASHLAHGDLSPHNIVLGKQNRATLLGPGLHAAMHPNEDQYRDQRGRRPYDAPERLSHGASPAADLYSLGLILYELLTSRQAAATVAGYIPGKRDSQAPKPPAPFRQVAPHLPRALEVLTFSLLQSRPDDRCPSAGEFRDRVLRLVQAAQRRRTPRPAS